MIGEHVLKLIRLTLVLAPLNLTGRPSDLQQKYLPSKRPLNSWQHSKRANAQRHDFVKFNKISCAHERHPSVNGWRLWLSITPSLFGAQIFNGTDFEPLPGTTKQTEPRETTSETQIPPFAAYA